MRGWRSPPGNLLTCVSFFFNDPPTTEIYTLSLHDALPISRPAGGRVGHRGRRRRADAVADEGRRSEEHTSELPSLAYLVCRLLSEKYTLARTLEQALALTCCTLRSPTCSVYC